MGEVQDIAVWRARRQAREDISLGAPPFVLEEPCPGCGARRVVAMVWRNDPTRGSRVPFPRVEPHFRCREGRVQWQEITDAPIPMSSWSAIRGSFDEAAGAAPRA